MLLSLSQLANRYFSGKFTSRQVKRWVYEYEIPHKLVASNNMMLIEDADFQQFIHWFPCSSSYTSEITPRTKWLTPKEVAMNVIGDGISPAEVRKMVHETNVMHYQTGHHGNMLIASTAAKQLKRIYQERSGAFA